MEYIKALAITIGYSVDIFFAGISFGLMIRKLTLKKTLKIAITVAIIQSVTVWIGYQLSEVTAKHIECINHWIAFVILLVIGIFMISHSYHNVEFDQKESRIRWILVVLVSIASTTDLWSITAKQTMLDIMEWSGILMISIESVVSVVLGMMLGHYLGVKYRYKSEFAAGIIFIVLAIKLFFAGIFIGQ